MQSGTPSGAVHTTVDRRIGWVTISNPARRNALTVEMMRRLDETLRDLDGNPSIRVIVLRGEGSAAFAAGADISEFESRQGSVEARAQAERTEASLFGGLAALSTPLIAMIHGFCFGAGVAVALGADIRIAADDSSFAIPAARLGISYPVTLTHALVQVVGPGHASEILFGADRVRARDAVRMGLVNRILPAAELEAATRALAETIALNAPMTIRAAKSAIKALTDGARRDEAEAYGAACAGSEDASEGRQAFMQKRPPKFLGR